MAERKSQEETERVREGRSRAMLRHYQKRERRDSRPEWMRNTDLLPKKPPAGTNTGGRWSPFRETCDKIRRFVEQHPGATLAEVISGVDHHYRKDSTAHASISKWARLGKIRGVVVRKDGRLYRMYVQETAS